MTTTTQVAMLAANDVSIADVQFPILASTKYDGIRALVHGGLVVARSNIPIPNQYVQHRFAHEGLQYLDGELIFGDPSAPDCFSKTDSAVMRGGGTPDFRYYAFDDLTRPDLPFVERQQRLQARSLPHWCIKVPQVPVESPGQLATLYSALLAQGHEGVILRNPRAPYKRGRGTKRAQDMMKLKPREASEAVILGFEELQRNNNVAFVGERGQTKRTSHKAGKVAGGTVGKFLVRDIEHGWEFAIGTFKGLTAPVKQKIWDNQDEYVGRILTYTYSAMGMKDLPRQPSFKGWRDLRDMS